MDTPGGEIDSLTKLLARLPGLGPRSARRAALELVCRKQALLAPLSTAMAAALEKVRVCSTCGNVDTRDPCAICSDPRRPAQLLCVVETVSDLWALERAGAVQGRYHVLGGVLSALDGVGPGDLNLKGLQKQAAADSVEEVVLAMNATVDGQITAHYITDHLQGCGVRITRLAHGVPVGGELDYLDDGTLSAAMRARRPL